MTKGSIDDVLRRPARHWSSDGLADLLVGIVLLLCGMAASAQQLWPSRLTTFLAAFVPSVTGVRLAIFHRAVARGLQSLKERWIYPRVGYVKVLGPARAHNTAAAVVGGVVAVVVAFAGVRSAAGDVAWVSFLPIVIGIAYALADALFWVVLGIGRLLVYALVALAAGALAQWLLPAALGVGVVVCVAGLSWAVGGALVLREVLRLPPVTEDQA